MSAAIKYVLNEASAGQIAAHLARCDAEFVPPLSGRVKIEDYAEKITSNAARFEAWSGRTLIGLVAAYCNDREKGVAYVTSVSVLREWTGRTVAAHLLDRCVEHAKASGMRQISLKVSRDNTAAVKLYEKIGFKPAASDPPFLTMDLYLQTGRAYEQA